MVEQLRLQWKRLWQERLDDKLRAEGMATSDYCDLFIEKGTVIHATRDFNSLSGDFHHSHIRLRWDGQN
jgi:hypothetical protein